MAQRGHVEGSSDEGGIEALKLGPTKEDFRQDRSVHFWELNFGQREPIRSHFSYFLPSLISILESKYLKKQTIKWLHKLI